MSDEELNGAPVPEPESDGHSASEPTANQPEANAGDFPIPFIPRSDPRALEDRRRLRHRRKRFTLYVLRTARRRQEHKRSVRTRTIVLSVASLAVLIMGTIATLGELAYSYYESQAPVLAALQHSVLNSDSLRIYDMHGTLIYQQNNNGVKHSVAYDQIPMNMVNATVAIEDKGFWTNDGVDYQRIISATLQDYTKGHIDQGASTITQQLMKNTVLDSSVTLDRKVREAILAFGLTKSGEYSKKDIINMYLNTVPYGPYIYSVDAAAHTYFGFSDNTKTGEAAAHHLDLAQCSFLAGIPQNPVGYYPLMPDGLTKALSRQQEVLKAMVQQKYITQDQADAATKEANTPGFVHQPPDERQENLAPHFVYYVLNQLSSMVSTGQLDLSRSGLSVYTTLDLPLQQKTQGYIYDHLYGANGGLGDKDAYRGNRYISQDNVSNSAAMIAEQKTGDIRVLLGSYDYYATKAPNGKPVDGKFDVATQGFRQPGSSFKPLVYTTAFNMGWYPAMTINDIPTYFPLDGSGKPYKPLDAEREKYYGEMTIRKALQFSMDIPAIKTLSFVGEDNLLNTMARLGVAHGQDDSPGLSNAIGSFTVHLSDMVQAYTTFANYGRKIPLNAVDHIADGDGNVIYQYSPPRGEQIFSPQVTFLTTSVLSDNGARAGERGVFGFGLCSPLLLYPQEVHKSTCSEPYWQSTGYYPAAAKTGTTDDLKDDWTMGYTMDFTGGVWVGNNDNTSMTRIDGITGAAPIWHNMMLAAEQSINAQPTPFPVPQGVVRATYSSNGITSQDWFLANNVPVEQGTGNGGTTSVCININNNDGSWNYCSGPASGGPSSTPTP